MRVIAIAPAALIALVTLPASGAGLKATVNLPNGVVREVLVVVPEAQVKEYEAKGYHRAAITREEAIKYRDSVCGAAKLPQPRPGVPLRKLCDGATQALAEWK